ncbi:MAG: hypothetical protein MMC23_004843 [Stictis urceolatum]|nr:hypothetical protein [Stictis urceolata]
MAQRDSSSKEGLLKATGSSPRQSLEADIDAQDTTKLLHDSNVPTKPTRTPPRKKSWTSWSCLSILGIIAVGIVGVAMSGGYFVYHYAPTDGQSPPWYPSPRGGTLKSWEESYKKAHALVSKMSLVEKVNVTSGVGWMSGRCLGDTAPAVDAGFPGLCLQDGPLGLRRVDNVTAFPAGITVGATWNKDIMYRRGRAYGKEARLKGVNVILGPGVGALGKIPAGGRNWEGFGTDPVIQGVAAAETIRGIQEEGVMATIKHFVANEQEHFRQSFEWGLPNAISSNIDDRTMHEVYAWPFADSIRAGVASVMCSYNQVNNSYACGNSKLMNGILKDELGFQGFVQSDWLAQRSGVGSALAGLDVTMPGDGLHWADGKSLFGEHLTLAALNGSLPMERLNDMVTRIVAAWYQLEQDSEKKFPVRGPNFSSWTDKKVDRIHWSGDDKNNTGVVNEHIDVQGKGIDFHGRIAKEAAAEGTVLVKNEGGLLPLSRKGLPSDHKPVGGAKCRVGIFGDDAGPGKGANACEDRGCNEGTLAMGWGSGTAEFPYLVTPVEALEAGFDPSKVKVESYLTNTPDFKKQPSIIEYQDICIVFVNSDSGEGFLTVDGMKGDRNDLLPQKGGDKLVQDVASNCGKGQGKTIVVVHAVGPVLLEHWIDLPGVKAVVLAHLPGQESGNALAGTIFGDYDASGRLPYTIGKSLEDYGPGAQLLYWPNGIVPQQDFDEGLYIDYRHFDKFDITPRYEFGFGLSYTTFDYSDLKLTTLKKKSPLPSPRPDTLSPPSYGNEIPDPETALLPPGFRKIKKRVYPYIHSTSQVKKGAYPYPSGYDREQTPFPAGGGEGGNPSLYNEHLSISLKVTNTGPRRGKDVVQVYVSFPENVVDENGDRIEFPVRVLRAFEKVEVKKEQSAIVELKLTRRDLSYWSVVRQNWVMPEGEFTVAVGRSSRDIVLEGKW